MQMRIHTDKPVEARRNKSREGPRCNRLTRLEATILAHVGKIWCH